MLNYIWLALVLLAVLIGGVEGKLDLVTKEALDRASFAIMNLALPLAGIMTLWLGIMRLAERAGLVQLLARGLRPLLRLLFPEVPAEHPAMGAMVMNMAANILGLGNAATPLGLRAMKLLDSLNPLPGTATNAMCTFLAINTASVQLIPMTAIGVLAASGSKAPTAIVGTAIIASFTAACCAMIAVKLFARLPMFKLPAPEVTAGPVQNKSAVEAEPAAVAAEPAPLTSIGSIALTLFFGFFGFLFVKLTFPQWFGGELTQPSTFIRAVTAISVLAIPFLLSAIPLIAALRRVKVYEEFVEGAKEGFQTAVRIMPYLVAILVAIGMFRAAGGIEMLSGWLAPVLNRVGFPTELLPMAFMRPLSGSGSLGVLTDIAKTHGADSLLARTAATIFGSTETTFYVLAVYFGSVGVKRTRHALAAGLVADVVGISMSVFICWLMLR
jgi:spore maturation protein SpmA